MKKPSLITISLVCVAWACVDKVNLTLENGTYPTIVDGFIDDGPGPYTIQISKGAKVDGLQHLPIGVRNAQVIIRDDVGNVDHLVEGTNGIYSTTTLKGVVGRSYRLSATLIDGTTFESASELMRPAGTINNIYFDYKFEDQSNGELPLRGFNVYVDATTTPGTERRMRWKWRGTFTYQTDPSLITLGDPPKPIACATNCVCCTCWATERELNPILSKVLVGSDNLNRVLVAYVQIDQLRFFAKYKVEIEQMEISKVVFDFYNALAAQRKSTSTLFQPPFFELKGNVEGIGPSKVIGIFNAAAVTRGSIYIHRQDIPGGATSQVQGGDCRGYFPTSTLTQPSWYN